MRFYNWRLRLTDECKYKFPKTTYRAEIRVNDRIVARLRGRRNTEEQLIAWVSEHWPGSYVWEDDNPYWLSMTLRVWRYSFSGVDVIVDAQMLVPVEMYDAAVAFLKDNGCSRGRSAAMLQ